MHPDKHYQGWVLFSPFPQITGLGFGNTKKRHEKSIHYVRFAWSNVVKRTTFLCCFYSDYFLSEWPEICLTSHHQQKIFFQKPNYLIKFLNGSYFKLSGRIHFSIHIEFTSLAAKEQTWVAFHLRLLCKIPFLFAWLLKQSMTYLVCLVCFCV